MKQMEHPVQDAFFFYAQQAKIKGPFSSSSPQGYSISILRSGLQKSCRRGNAILMLKCMFEMLCFGYHEKGKSLVSSLYNRLRMILIEDCVVSWKVMKLGFNLISQLKASAGNIESEFVIARQIASLFCQFPKGRILSHIRAVFGRGWQVPSLRQQFKTVYLSLGCTNTDPNHDIQQQFIHHEISCIHEFLNIPRRVEAFRVLQQLCPDDKYKEIIQTLSKIASNMSRWEDQQLCALSAFIRCGPWFVSDFFIDDDDCIKRVTDDDRFDWNIEFFMKLDVKDALEDSSIVDMHCIEGRKNGADALSFAQQGALIAHEHPSMQKYRIWEDVYMHVKKYSVEHPDREKDFQKEWKKMCHHRSSIINIREWKWKDMEETSVPNRKICGKKPIVVFALHTPSGRRVALKKLNQIVYGINSIYMHHWSTVLNCPSLECQLVYLDVDLCRKDPSQSQVIENWIAVPSVKKIPYLCVDFLSESQPLGNIHKWWTSSHLWQQYLQIGIFSYIFGISDFHASNVLFQCHSQHLMPIDRMEILKDVEFMGRLRKELKVMLYNNTSKLYVLRLLSVWIPKIESIKYSEFEDWKVVSPSQVSLRDFFQHMHSHILEKCRTLQKIFQKLA